MISLEPTKRLNNKIDIFLHVVNNVNRQNQIKANVMPPTGLEPRPHVSICLLPKCDDVTS